MKHLIYEIVKHGVHTPDTFPGCGVALTPFEHAATGSGSSECEAGEDAFSIMLQTGTWDDVSIVDLGRLEAEISWLSQEENAHERCEAGCYDKDCDAAHYVSIRWRVE